MTPEGQSSVAGAAAVPGIPSDADGVVFREPWEGQAFAIAFALSERGCSAGLSGRRRSPMRSARRRVVASPIPARPTTTTGSPHSSAS